TEPNPLPSALSIQRRTQPIGQLQVEAKNPAVSDARSTGRRASSDDHSSRQFQLLGPVARTTDHERTVIYSDRAMARRAWVSALGALFVPPFPAARVARNGRRRPQQRRRS